MARGRPPKPTKLHRLHGTYRPKRHRGRADDKLTVADDLVEPPEWFTPSQREGWEYAIRHCPRGVLKMLDRGALVLWVEAEDRHRAAMIAQTNLNNRSPEVPYLVKGPDGLMVSPYVEIIDRAAKIMIRMISELGFSPVARPRIKLVPSIDETVETDVRTDPWKFLEVVQGGKADPAAAG